MGGKLSLGLLLQEWDTVLLLGLGSWPRTLWGVTLLLEATSSTGVVRSGPLCTFLVVSPSSFAALTCARSRGLPVQMQFHAGIGRLNGLVFRKPPPLPIEPAIGPVPPPPDWTAI
eukprot:916301-Pyramimonas_sp.AAC.1